MRHTNKPHRVAQGAERVADRLGDRMKLEGIEEMSAGELPPAPPSERRSRRGLWVVLVVLVVLIVAGIGAALGDC